MSIYKVTKENLVKLNKLFEKWEDTMVLSCLQGYMGSAYVDSNHRYQSARIFLADFCFVAGKATEEIVKYKPKEYQKDYMIMIPENLEWQKIIEQIYGEKCNKISRYALKKKGANFDKQKLTNIVSSINSSYKIKTIDEEMYHKVLMEEWSKDLCFNFANYQDYKENGLGVVALCENAIVSGASSYSYYKEGIEIEIDTRLEDRSKGLASACGAKLILECIEKNLYPSWDAHNKISLRLAEKLGYHFDKEYVAYEIIMD